MLRICFSKQKDILTFVHSYRFFFFGSYGTMKTDISDPGRPEVPAPFGWGEFLIRFCRHSIEGGSQYANGSY